MRLGDKPKLGTALRARLKDSPTMLLKKMLWPPANFSAPTEALFRAEYAANFAPHRRAALLLGCVTWIAYYGWDFYHAKHANENQFPFMTILLLRSLGALMLLVVTTASFSPSFHEERTANALLGTVAIFSYIMLLLMIMVTPFPFNYLAYFVGLPLVMLFMFGLMRLRAKVALTFTAIFLLLSGAILPFAVILGRPPIMSAVSGYYYYSAITYLLSFTVVGCAIAVEFERTARQAFSRQHELAQVGADLSEKNDELSRLNLSLRESERDTQIKTNALIALKDQLRAQAEKQNIAKSKFLADAAHDLRQPMQALTNLLEAAQHALISGDQAKCIEHLAFAQDASRLTRSTFNAVLDISRLESGFVKAEISTFAVQTLIDEVLPSTRLLAKDRNVSVRVHRSKLSDASVRSDRHLLGRVIANLLSNAVKYSDSGKADLACAMIGVVSFSNRIRIDIIDNGIGIADSDWPEIFKPFVQLHNPEQDGDRGIGLGLSIVNAIINILPEHRIELTSVPGRGTRFSIDIPRADSQDAALVRKKPIETSPNFDFSGLYIFYVEDDPLVRKSTIAIFDAYKILYEEFESFTDLQGRLNSFERNPDLLISDYRLPNDKTAVDVIETINAFFGTSIPTIILTGEVATHDWSGFRPSPRIMQKPVSPKILLSEIGALYESTV